jgi:type I restriction enzyme S subunit
MKQRYNEYKSSDVEWIGEIPKHWNIGSMKYVLSKNDGGVWGEDTEDFEDGVFVIRSTEITVDGKWDLSDPMKRKLSEKELEKCRLVCGDIVITKSSGSPDHIGKSVIVDEYVESLTCCYSNFVQRIRFKNYNPQLYHYILNSQIVREQFRYLTQSTTGLGNLSGTTLNDIILPFIPISEQEQIVKYLDEKTNQIDQLISITEKKIDGLKEKRTSLINHVVTKGLDSNVEMKDSGVEWIGKIPKHWNKKKIKHVVNIFGRIGYRGYTIEDIVNEGEGVITISPSNIKNDIFSIENNNTYITYEKYFQSPEIMIFPNDIILVKTGSTIGKTSIIPEGVPEMTINPQLVVLKEIKLFPKYLYYQTTCNFIKESFDVEQTGSTTPTISQEKINEFPILSPPISEQEQIVKHIETQTIEIDNLISIERKRIETLKEYRQSLISEVVTGKIRVCEEVSELQEN